MAAIIAGSLIAGSMAPANAVPLVHGFRHLLDIVEHAPTMGNPIRFCKYSQTKHETDLHYQLFLPIPDDQRTAEF